MKPTKTKLGFNKKRIIKFRNKSQKMKLSIKPNNLQKKGKKLKLSKQKIRRNRKKDKIKYK